MHDELPEDAVVTAHIEIIRYMSLKDGTTEGHSDLTLMSMENGESEKLPLVEALGLLRLAEDTAFAMWKNDCDCHHDDA